MAALECSYYSNPHGFCVQFNFEIVNFPFLDGDALRFTSNGVYISKLIRFTRASSRVADFNTCNKLLHQKFLKQGYQVHKLLQNLFLKSKFNNGCKSLLC